MKGGEGGGEEGEGEKPIFRTIECTSDYKHKRLAWLFNHKEGSLQWKFKLQ